MFKQHAFISTNLLVLYIKRKPNQTRSICLPFGFFWPCHMAFGITAPRPGIEPEPPTLEVQSPNHWTTREFPCLRLYCHAQRNHYEEPMSRSFLLGILWFQVLHLSEVKVAQSCPTFCNPMDYTVHGIVQARILEWVAFPFSKVSSQPRDGTQVSHTAIRFFTS